MSEKTFIVIKALSTLPSLEQLSEHVQNNTEYFYFNLTEAADQDKIALLEHKKYRTYILVFTQDEEKKSTPIKLYAGTGKQSGTGSINCKINYHTEDPVIMGNFVSCTELDLDKDYAEKSYINIEKSTSLIQQMDLVLPSQQYNSSACNKKLSGYEDLGEHLHLLAQKNHYCKREYMFKAVHVNTADSLPEIEFRRDYERIIGCKAFRRMVDKAQIFSARKGDHYRTRMTHTLLVSQIACKIAGQLGLNRHLTEAIALGHDLGHTPFGHQGERTLNSILTGEIAIIRPSFDGAPIDFGGFKHNYQSLRVATKLEEAYIQFDGLDLSYQTLDGMWKHTKCKPKEYDIHKFVNSQSLIEYMSQSEFPLTLEGQVVQIADEIAQRGHDLEDSFSAKRLSIEELQDYLSLNKMDMLKSEIDKIESEIDRVKNNGKLFADENELWHTRISAQVTEYFVNDVHQQSIANINKYLAENGEEIFRKNGCVVREKLIQFSSTGASLCEYLEKIITKRVIASSEVSLFDDNGAKIVEGLFRSYYRNPRLLHKGTLNRIMMDTRKVSSRVIHFQESDVDIARDEWARILNTKSEETDCIPHNEEYRIDYEAKHEIFVKSIIDFISGMTDSYARNEYEKLLGC